MIIPESIEGDSVALLPLLPEHVTEEYLGWLNDPEVIRFTEVCPGQTMQAVRAYVRDTNMDPNAVIWRIMAPHRGNIRLSNISRKHQRAEVAILIGRPHWGLGIGPAAVQALTKYATGELGLKKLVAFIHRGNVGSQKAFAKAGYQHEATLRGHAVLDGQRHDVQILSYATF